MVERAASYWRSCSLWLSPSIRRSSRARRSPRRAAEIRSTLGVGMHAGQANHSSVVAMPGGKEQRIAFEELAGDGSVCRARGQPMGAWAVGGTTYVIAQASGRPARDAWVEAVAAALARERGWRERRWTLTVRMGEEIMFHVTAASNRESIAAHGFDSQRMGTATGIAGSPQPELPGVFVCDSREAAQFF